ncbi:hypothetical protein B0H13DRAFT_1904928 [Mycena leptocephala]|nr:hypothetical protein B0H13DRAFT_1904928 [Mycena leptocephala]
MNERQSLDDCATDLLSRGRFPPRMLSAWACLAAGGEQLDGREFKQHDFVGLGWASLVDKAPWFEREQRLCDILQFYHHGRCPLHLGAVDMPDDAQSRRWMAILRPSPVLLTPTQPAHARQFTTNRMLQATMLTLFLSSTLQFVTDFVFSIAQVQGYLMSTRFPLPERKDALENTHLPFYVLQRWPAAINFIISDLIVLWRACSLRQCHRWLKAAPWGLGVADVAAAFTSRDATRRSTDRSTEQTINTVSVVISLIINVVGTVAIGVEAQPHYDPGGDSAMAWRRPAYPTSACRDGLHLGVRSGCQQGPSHPLDMATGAILKMALYLAAILPTVTLIIVRSKRSVEDSLQPSEMSSVCQQCSSVVSISGTRARTRGEAVRLTMLPGSPNDQSKSWFGKEPTGPITVMMEQETEVSRASPNSTLVAARLGGTVFSPDPPPFA